MHLVFVCTQAALRRLLRGRRWLALHRRFWRAPSGCPEEDLALDRAAQSPYQRLMYFIAAVTDAVVLWVVLPNLWTATHVEYDVIASVLGIIVDRTLVVPFANFMASPERERILMALSLVALLLGTAMTVLAD